MEEEDNGKQEKHRTVVFKSALYVFAKCLDCTWHGDLSEYESASDIARGCTIASQQAEEHASGNLTTVGKVPAYLRRRSPRSAPGRHIRTIPRQRCLGRATA